jgi:hypothetical protein
MCVRFDLFVCRNLITQLIALAERSKASVCGRLLAGVAGSNPGGAWMSVSCECCRVEISATSRSLVQGRPTDCGMSK